MSAILSACVITTQSLRCKKATLYIPTPSNFARAAYYIYVYTRHRARATRDRENNGPEMRHLASTLPFPPPLSFTQLPANSSSACVPQGARYSSHAPMFPRGKRERESQGTYHGSGAAAGACAVKTPQPASSRARAIVPTSIALARCSEEGQRERECVSMCAPLSHSLSMRHRIFSASARTRQAPLCESLL